jgi:hypothetical protein
MDVYAILGSLIGFLIAGLCYMIGVIVGESREARRRDELDEAARRPRPQFEMGEVERTGTVSRFRRA